MATNITKNIEQYIDLVYSQKSPLIGITNLHERKLAACKKLKLDPEAEETKKITELKDDKICNAVIEHLWKNESTEFMDLMSDSHLLLELQIMKMTPLTITDDEEKNLKAVNLKTTISAKSKELIEKMNVSYSKIFKGPAEISAAKKKVSWMTFEQRIKKRDEQKQAASVPQNQ